MPIPQTTPDELTRTTRLIVQLEEVQSASHGRKFGAKDRRPLDPPPVVRLRVFRAGADSEYGEEVEIDDVPQQDIAGFICICTLVPTQTPENSAESASDMDGVVETEASLADALFGASVSQLRIVPYDGSNAGVFVFGDLSVRRTGFFHLRYRCYNLFARTFGNTGHSHTSLAECTGSTFRVYPSKLCPPMRASTPLTRLVADYGADVHLRKKERKTGSP